MTAAAGLPDLGDLRDLVDADRLEALLTRAGMPGPAMPCWLHLGDDHAIVGVRLGLLLGEGPITAYLCTGPPGSLRVPRQRGPDRPFSDVIEITDATTLLLFPADRRLGDLSAVLEPARLAAWAGLGMPAEVRADRLAMRTLSWRPEQRLVVRLSWPDARRSGSTSRRGVVVRYEASARRASAAASAALSLGRSAPGLAPRPWSSSGALLVEEELVGRAVDLDRDAHAVGAALAHLHRAATDLPERGAGHYVERAGRRLQVLARAGVLGRGADPVAVLRRLVDTTLAPLTLEPAATVTGHGRLTASHLRVVEGRVRFCDLADVARHAPESDLADLVVRSGPSAARRLLTAYADELDPVDDQRLSAHLRIAHLGRAVERLQHLGPGWSERATAHVDAALGGRPPLLGGDPSVISTDEPDIQPRPRR